VRLRAALIALLLAPAVARANGAFPDALSILLPTEPQKISLATNFGLVFTTDGGRTWEWTCEHDSSLGAILYQLAPPPKQTIFALGLDLVHSDDDGCVWTPATGRAAQGFLYDLFVDPSDGNRVLAVADPNDETPKRVHVFESLDGGTTFPGTVYDAEPGVDISGVETAFSDPKTLYVTWASSRSGQLREGIVRVQPGGTQTFDHYATFGGDALGIAAVDRQDPRKLFLRAFGAAKDRLAISDDGGATVRVVLEVEGALAGFVRRPDGTIFAAASTPDRGTLFVSHDDGKTFTAQPPAPRFRALADRAGILYAAADDIVDGFALAISIDDGKSWTPVLRFSDVKRVKSCPGTMVATSCGGSCAKLVSLQTFRPQVCGTPHVDAGAPDAAAPIAAKSGCACGLGGSAPGPSGALLLLLALVFRLRRRG
jgi:hypothetical protein